MKLDGKKNRVYLILGDGESQEGQVWEMALFAAQRKLSNLTAFLDNNRLQLDDRTDNICSLGNIKAKFEAFGWFAQEVNGHDVSAIAEAVEKAKAETERPSMIILDTEKAHGWSEMAGQVKSHCPKVSAEQLQSALSEMESDYKTIEKETTA